MSNERFTVQVPKTILSELRDEANREGLSLSSHIRRIAIVHLRKNSEDKTLGTPLSTAFRDNGKNKKSVSK